MKDKRVNRKALTEAIRTIVGEQRAEARKVASEKHAEEMQMDERVLVLRSLIELHPSLKELLEETINNLIAKEGYEATKDLPGGWVSHTEAEIIRARLELIPDPVLQSLTIEELASETRS